MASMNQTRPYCLNRMGKTHSKPLAARHGRGTAWTRHGNSMLCVNRPLQDSSSVQPIYLGSIFHGTSFHFGKYRDGIFHHVHQRRLLCF